MHLPKLNTNTETFYAQLMLYPNVRANHKWNRFRMK